MLNLENCRPRPRCARHRCGVAATEFAVCLPVIVVLLLGALEASNVIFLKQSLSIAAYEGARTAVTLGAADADAHASGHRMLEQRRVADATISVSPSPLSEQPAGSWITVTVSAPVSSNTVVQAWLLNSQIVSARATMMKEY